MSSTVETSNDYIIKMFTELFSSYYEKFLEMFHTKYVEFLKKKYSYYLFKKIINIHRKRLDDELVRKFSEISVDSHENIDYDFFSSFVEKQMKQINQKMDHLLSNIKDALVKISENNTGEQKENETMYQTDFFSDTECHARNKIFIRKSNKIQQKRRNSEKALNIMSVSNETAEPETNVDINNLNEFDDQTPQVRLGMRVFTIKSENDFEWIPAKINRIKMNKLDEIIYYVILENKDDMNDTDDGDKERLGCWISFSEPFNEILPIRSRIVALNKNEHDSNSPFLCAGTVAEIPTKFFQIYDFFDNGFAQYIQKNQILPMVDSFTLPKNLHDDHLSFLDRYFQMDPKKAMVRLTKHKFLKVNFNLNWHTAKVIDTDCSMVKLYFEDINHEQWLHRASYSIYQCFEKMLEQQDQCGGKKFTLNKNSLRRESSQSLSSHSSRKSSSSCSSVSLLSKASSTLNLSPFASTLYPSVKQETTIISKKKLKRGRMARKTLGRKNKPLSIDNLADLADKMKIQTEEIKKYDQGKLKKLDLRDFSRDYSIPFTAHPCTAACVAQWEKKDILRKAKNILLQPLRCGWQRHYAEASVSVNGKVITDIFYISPCGRRLRNIFEVDRYLFLTNSSLTIDMFSHEQHFHLDREFEANATFLNIPDITDGKEDVPIQCVNCVDDKKPDVFEYSKIRVPLEGVPLYKGPSLLEGCDCEDGCRNRLKCSCWRKTFEATTFFEELNINAGYHGRRLNYKVDTGIFECNSKCKCDHRCSNRVAQNGITHRLQLFKVSTSKGWGLRCLDDIPKGAFICNYNGHVLSEDQSDIRGKSLGDEYFAALDLVEELFDKSKEISNFSDSDSEEEVKNINNNNLLTENIEYIYLTSDDENYDEENNDNSSANKQKNSTNTIKMKITNNGNNNNQALSIINSNKFFKDKKNQFYFKNFLIDSVFILDAKIFGNIGRYFNHSCNPNIYVQSVFYDTYDLRFPSIAFFATHCIKAGTELCWDYKYQKDSVEGKVLFCSCGAPQCKGQLL